jgi:hypothetical protein
LVSSKSRRQEPGLGGTVLGVTLPPSDAPAASQKDEQLKTLGRGGSQKWDVENPFFRCKVRAGDKESLFCSGVLKTQGLELCAGLRAETHDGESFLNMKFAHATLSVGPIVVEDAIGEIGVLLNFAEDKTRSNRMRRACGYEDRFAFGHWHMLEAVFRRAIRDRLLELLARNFWFETRKHFGARTSAKGVPHFRFAESASGPFMLASVLIIWMNLHGEFIFGEDELCQDWEKSAGGNRVAAPLDRHFGPDFTEPSASVGAIRENAFGTGHPSFANRLRQIGLAGEKRRER